MMSQTLSERVRTPVGASRLNRRRAQHASPQHSGSWLEKGGYIWTDTCLRARLAGHTMSDPQAYASWAAQWYADTATGVAGQLAAAHCCPGRLGRVVKSAHAGATRPLATHRHKQQPQGVHRQQQQQWPRQPRLLTFLRAWTSATLRSRKRSRKSTMRFVTGLIQALVGCGRR